MNNLKNLFNIFGNLSKITSLSELDIGKMYTTSKLKIVKTKYGEKVNVTLNNEFEIILPNG